LLSVHDRLIGFLAARCLQNIHFSNALREWNKVRANENRADRPEDDRNHHDHHYQHEHHRRHHSYSHPEHSQDQYAASATLETADLLERYALLVCSIQRTPLEIIQQDFFEDSTDLAVQHLDEIAMVCRERIAASEMANTRISCWSGGVTAKKLQLVNEVLVQVYGFSGNQDDYYNYRNSLLDHTIASKKGIPLTLCIVYSCICRRLGIPVYLTGLPGHVVLGFAADGNDSNNDDADAKQQVFMDVFHGGRVLSVSDCQDIVSSYGVPWDDKFLLPLPVSMIIQRILNNLNNCHFQAMAANAAFHSDLYFHLRALSAIHRQPPNIAGPLVERIIQELPITLSPDLLRVYWLLSQRAQEVDNNERNVAGSTAR
jgi:regulator of sirC expression with transglutaminase-like and TPR domain